jgi:hypothetical protein
MADLAAQRELDSREREGQQEHGARPGKQPAQPLHQPPAATNTAPAVSSHTPAAARFA